MEQAEVGRGVAGDMEVRGIAGLAEHGGGVAAHQHGFAGLKIMVVVQSELVRMFGDASEVMRYLAIILAAIFQFQFERADRHRVKADHSSFSFDFRIVECNP